MSKIKSIYGPYAERMQIMIDNSLDKFSPVWFPRYFDWARPQSSLTFVSAIGASRIEAAASVVNRDSAAPLRSRPDLKKYSGEIPAIKEKFKMSESDYRDFLTLQGLAGIDDATKKQQLLDLMFSDVKTVGDAAMKRVDIMALQAVSTGKIKINVDTNPDGLAVDEIDLFMPAENRINSAVSWDNGGSSTPLTDIQGVVEAADAKGVKFSKMLMTRSLWLKLIKSTEVKNVLATFLNLKQNNVMPTLANVNSFMQENLFPVIEIVDSNTVGIEKDGVISAINPFSLDNVAFVPDGKLGVIKNAVAIEQISPVDQVTYAKFNNALISKWKQNDPFGEFTAVELNAFPAFERIDSVYILAGVHA